MTARRWFRGDDNLQVQRLQRGLRGQCLGDLLRMSRDRYLMAERTIGIETELGKDLRAANTVNHSFLYYVHDTIAASFRCKYAEQIQPDLPGVLSDLSHEERVEVDWVRYFNQECESLADYHVHAFVRRVLAAALYPDPDPRGIAARDALSDSVFYHYDHLWD